MSDHGCGVSLLLNSVRVALFALIISWCDVWLVSTDAFPQDWTSTHVWRRSAITSWSTAKRMVTTKSCECWAAICTTSSPTWTICTTTSAQSTREWERPRSGSATPPTEQCICITTANAKAWALSSGVWSVLSAKSSSTQRLPSGLSTRTVTDTSFLKWSAKTPIARRPLNWRHIYLFRSWVLCLMTCPSVLQPFVRPFLFIWYSAKTFKSFKSEIHWNDCLIHYGRQTKYRNSLICLRLVDQRLNYRLTRSSTTAIKFL